jgi:membrane fusion protein, multidrug efflux system
MSVMARPHGRRGSAGAAAFVLVTVLAAACGRQSSGTEAVRPPAASTVDVVRVVERPIDGTVSMPGELEAYETVAVFPRATGFIRSIAVDRGSRVRAGQVLATLDAPELIAQRAEAQSKLQGAVAQLAAVRAKADSAASTYEKLKAAAATPGVVAGNDVAIAQKAAEAERSEVAAAEQNAEGARQALRSIAQLEGYLRITAPFDGVVTERNVHPGALVGPASGATSSTPLFRVVQDRRLRLVVPLPEAYAANVTEGATVSFSVRGYPGQAFSGRVARVSHSLDVKTRTMAVELDVTNADGRLAPGTYAQVGWPLRRAGPSLLVPPGTIATTTDRTFVVRVRGGHAEWVDVKTGMSAGGLVEVFGDLRPGDEVAARGTDELRNGTAVTARAAAPK